MSDTPPVLGPQHALFLDFDGTLVNIAPTPDSVTVPVTLVPLLARLRTRLDGALAVVSGRNLDDVMSYLAPLVLPGAGTHGMERRRFDGSLDLPGKDVAAEADEMAAAATAATAAFPGVMVEHKPYSVGLHYRAVPEREEACLNILTDLIRDRRHGWDIVKGKLIAEARLGGFSKASAVRAFMAEPPFAGRIPVFVGDDVTDEDGMKAAAEFGGFGIKVGMGDSVGRYRLADPAAVHGYLAAIV